VPFEHWDGDQVQIGQDVVDANVNVHVEQRAAMMDVAIPGDRERPD